MSEINLRNYAHLGDAVWELFIREHTILKTCNTKELHKITTEKVNAAYQAQMLKQTEAELTIDELEIVRRARNLPVPVARRSCQSEYRQATAFETLIGFWYLNDKERLSYIFKKIDEKL